MNPNEYKIWTTRALLVWVPVCLLLGLTPPAVSVYLSFLGFEVPWHVHIVNSLMPLVVAYIAYRRHELHARIKDSIDRYLPNGTRVVCDVPYLTEEEYAALDRGVRRACDQLGEYPSAVKNAFLIVRAELYVHRAGKNIRVGGLTYHGGPMLIEYTSDLRILEDRARHETCHYLLNRQGVQDWSGDMHHQHYPELFN